MINRIKLYRSWMVFFLIPALFITGCSNQKKGRPPVTMVTVAKAVIQPEALSINVVGTVEPIETVTLRAQVSGVISRVNFTEGDEVKEGQVLFQIDPQPFKIALDSAKAQLAKNRALALNAENQAKRYADLVKKDYVTKEQYETIKAQAEMYKATIQGDEANVAEAKLNLDYTSVKATISGRTGTLLVHRGSLVKSNDTPLIVINKMRPILVRFSIPGSQLPLVQKYASNAKNNKIDQLEVRARSSRETDQKQPVSNAKGHLYFSDNAVDPATGTVTLKALFPNEDGSLWPGQFVDTELILTVENNALTIPSVAVVAGQEGNIVFVVGPDKKAQKRLVKVNRMVNDKAVIDEGITAGDSVVTDGQMRLVSGALVEVKTESSGLLEKNEKRNKK